MTEGAEPETNADVSDSITRLKSSGFEALTCLSGHVTPGDPCRARGWWKDFKDKRSKQRSKRADEKMSGFSFHWFSEGGSHQVQEGTSVQLKTLKQETLVFSTVLEVS